MFPITSSQAIIVAILVICSEFIRAHILGTMSIVIHSLNRKSEKFQEQIEFATSTMRIIKLTEESQLQVIDYLVKRANDMDAQQDLQELM
jgi:hypothetical protein